jgi:phosphate transport system protein
MDYKRIFDQELEELKGLILKMGFAVQSLIHRSVEALKDQNVPLAMDLILEDSVVDQLDIDINDKCIRLIALRQPEASDLRFIMTAMRIATDLERMGDLTEDISQRTIELDGKPSIKPLIDIPKMAQLTESAVSIVLEAFIKKDMNKANKIWGIEKQVDELRDRVHVELSAIMSKDPGTVDRAIPLLLISRHLERICDHATNIAEDVVYMVEGKVVKHNSDELKKMIGTDWVEKKQAP